MTLTPEGKSTSRWKPLLWLVLKIYAGLSALLVTSWLVLVVWTNCFPRATAEPTAMSLQFSYDQYMAKESPERGDHFCGLASALAMRTKDVPVPTAEMFKYLGKPDLIRGTVETGTVVYLYGRSAFTNRYAVYAFIKDSKLTQIGFGDAKDVSAFETYRQ